MVFYAGIPYPNSQNLLMAYLDAGGFLYVSDNDLGYSQNSTIFYQEYLQAIYQTDDPGVDTLIGEDIMAGLDLDISADYYPDGFMVGAEGVEIFNFSGTSYAGGVAVDREDYKAVYTSFDFEFISSPDDGAELISRIIDFLVPTDVLWLGETPTSGTIPADSSVVMGVSFDAGAVADYGVYQADLRFKSNDPVNGRTAVPVTMNVVPPGYGRVIGTVISQGYCDVNPYPLAGIDVSIGDEIVVTTNDNGYYYKWLLPGTYEVEVSPDGQEEGSATVVVLADQTTTQDFDLRSLEPCISTEPSSYEVWLTPDSQEDQPLSLTNAGAGAATFEITDIGKGYTPLTSSEKWSQATITPRERLDGYNPNATSTKGILTDGGATGARPLAQGDVLDQWPTGLTLPWGTLFDQADTTVWFSNPTYDSLDHEYTTDGSATGRTASNAFGGTWSGDMAWNANTGMFWQVNVGGDNCLYEVDPNSGPTGNTICGPWPVSERGLAYDPTTDTFFVGSWNDSTIYHIDNSGALIEQWDVDLSISGLAYNFEAGLLFIMENTSTDTTSVFDVNSGMVIGSFTIPGFGNYAGAGLEVDCDGNLWAANQSDGNAYLIDSGVPASLCGVDAPWLSEDPMAGTVSAESSSSITVTFTVTPEMPLGDYFAELNVKTEDQVNPRVKLPVTLHVIGEYVAPAFTVEAGTPVLLGENMLFTLTVTDPGIPSVDEFTWNFGDDSPEEVLAPDAAVNHLYEAMGHYTVTVEGCSKTACETVEVPVDVRDLPVAGFSSNTPVLLGNPVVFNNTTVVGWPADTTYTWTFGDGTTSTVANPSHMYAAADTYHVSLEACNVVGCDDFTADVEVTGAAPVAAFTTNSPVTLGSPVSFANTTVVGNPAETTYTWTFGDGATSTEVNPMHTYTAVGTYHVTLEACNVVGCTTATKDVVVGMAHIYLPMTFKQ